MCRILFFNFYFGWSEASDVDSAAAVTIVFVISNPLTIFSMFFRSLAEAAPLLPPVLLLTVLDAALPTDERGDGDRWCGGGDPLGLTASKAEDDEFNPTGDALWLGGLPRL